MTAVAEHRHDRETRTANGVMVSIMGVVLVMAACLAAPFMMAGIRPSDPAAARAWDAAQARSRAEAAKVETVRLREVRTTILGNVPVECRAPVAAALPSDRPMTEPAMLETTLRICPQSDDGE
jgi:hypothetical protein